MHPPLTVASRSRGNYSMRGFVELSSTSLWLWRARCHLESAKRIIDRVALNQTLDQATQHLAQHQIYDAANIQLRQKQFVRGL